MAVGGDVDAVEGEPAVERGPDWRCSRRWVLRIPGSKLSSARGGDLDEEGPGVDEVNVAVGNQDVPPGGCGRVDKGAAEQDIVLRDGPGDGVEAQQTDVRVVRGALEEGVASPPAHLLEDGLVGRPPRDRRHAVHRDVLQ
eukprot:16427300-Heterocapsa_arctica.AAC.1